LFLPCTQPTFKGDDGCRSGGEEVEMLGKIAAVASIALLLTGGARAADIISYPTSTAQQLPVADDAGFDWNGFYAGVYGAVQHSPAGGDQYGLGIDAGINTTFDFVLAGAEVAVQGLGGGAGGTSYAQAVGRAGLLINDNTLLYGAAGFGLDTGAPDEGDLLAGGGLEYALGNDVSLRAQYLHGFPIVGTNPKDQVTLGAQFHF
jgi:outer membrane immunogenic protein